MVIIILWENAFLKRADGIVRFFCVHAELCRKQGAYMYYIKQQSKFSTDTASGAWSRGSWLRESAVREAVQDWFCVLNMCNDRKKSALFRDLVAG